MNSSSQGDTGNVRKSVGFMNTGEAEHRLDALMREKQHLEVPDNADAIACAAASSLADIGTAKVGKKGATNEHVQSPSSVRSNADDDDVAGQDFALAQNTGPKERRGQSKAKRGGRRNTIKNQTLYIQTLTTTALSVTIFTSRTERCAERASGPVAFAWMRRLTCIIFSFGMLSALFWRTALTIIHHRTVFMKIS